MAIAVDQTATGINPNGVTTATLTWATRPAAGTKVLVFVTSFVSVTSVVDNGATPKTFTLDANDNDNGGNDYFVQVWRADGITQPSSGSYHVTVTFSSAATGVAGGRSYTGVAAGAPSSTALQPGGASTGTSVTTGNVTPPSGGALLFGGFLTDSGANPESITLTTSGASAVVTETNGTILAGAGADHIVANTTSQGLAWTLGSSADWATVLACYAAAGGTPHTASASLSVTPSLSAGRVHGHFPAASLTVTPSLAAAGGHPRTAAASLSVAPSGTAAGADSPAFALLAEDGTPLLLEDGTNLETEDAPASSVTASLTVTPSLAATASHGHGASASLTVTPSLTAAGFHPRTAAASLTVTPSLTAASTQDVTASLAVTPSLAASASRGQAASASLTVTPLLTAVAGQAASLTVTPVLTASAVRGQVAAAALTVTPALAAAARHDATAAASLGVTPALSAAPQQGTGHSAAAQLAVAPALAAARRHAATAPAALTVTPALAASAELEVTVTGSWGNGYAVLSGFFFPFPSARPVQVSITNAEGDWLFALVAWRQPAAGAGTTVTVSDDAHNWWEPVGPPDTDSSASGTVRTAVWAAPAARVANTATGVTQVQVCATGPYISMAARIVDVSGLPPWYQVAALTTGFANSATSLSLSAAAPSSAALLFAAFASDNNADTVTGPSGWTALAAVTASNGVDHTADIKLTPAWQVTSASSSASVSSSGSLDLAGAIAGVLVSAPAPSLPSPDWPVMITEAAIGAGAQTPPSELTWTDISSRTLSMSMTQGRQYSLAQLSAGQGAVVLDNPDGDLIPPGAGPYAGIDSGTPLRRRVIVPASPTPYYVPVNGFFRRWPWQMDPALYRGQTQAEITDAWGYATVTLNSMAVEECAIDEPHSLWPLTDPAGSAGGSNLASGNSLQLGQVQSKLGNGGATTAWGQDAGILVGAQGAKVTASGAAGGATGMWQQALAGTSLAVNGYGYCLQCTDTAYPPVSGGVTVEVWGSADITPALTAISGNGLFEINPPGGTFNTAQSGFTDGQPVVLGVFGGGTFPTPFVAGTVYYVRDDDGQGNYNLAAAPGGSVITPTSTGITIGTITPQLAWDPVIMSLRDGQGAVLGLSVRNTDGALLLLARQGGTVTATAISSGPLDFRLDGPYYFSLAATQTAWRVLVDGGGTLSVSGTFASPLPATFRTLCFAGVQDQTENGYASPGPFGFAGVYANFQPQTRVNNRRWAISGGMADEAACDRVERILEYAGLTGRRWLGQQQIPAEGDLCVSGQDIGGQAAASSASNIAQSTLPALLYVAPTGDVTYLSKFYSWNQPVRWTLGTDAAGGEIPFAPGSVATDYDPSRVVEDVQLTQLDTQAVTLPDGTTASTTMKAVAAATEAQYGGSAYQQTGYVEFDGSSQYTAGSGLNDLANWLANTYAKPASRVQSITVEAAANSANASSWLAWQFWAGVSPGDMVQVNIRVPTAGTSPLISLVARVTQTQRQSQYSQDGTSATITCALDFAAEYQALTCDDPVRGLLNGTNVMPW